MKKELWLESLMSSIEREIANEHYEEEEYMRQLEEENDEAMKEVLWFRRTLKKRWRKRKLLLFSYEIHVSL